MPIVRTLEKHNPSQREPQQEKSQTRLAIWKCGEKPLHTPQASRLAKNPDLPWEAPEDNTFEGRKSFLPGIY